MAKIESDVKYSPSRIRTVRYKADCRCSKNTTEHSQTCEYPNRILEGYGPEKLLIGQKLQGLLPEIPPRKSISMRVGHSVFVV